jgi:hypothetical protein
LHGDLREALQRRLRVLPRTSPVLQRDAEVVDLSLEVGAERVVFANGSVDRLCH